MNTLNTLTIKEAAQGIREKKFSVSELVADCLEAIAGREGDVHAFLEVYAEDARAKARKADEYIAGGDPIPPLFGIPIAIKDNILIKGKRATAGSKILEQYTASFDAGVIKKLKNHGTIVLGKTNLDEFAMGSSTENSAFGPTKNPHDLGRVPGGSSGGSAAAVAAHFSLAALGSDTGGSVRQPASFCGVVGMKPTYGAVSRHGLIAMASSLDQIGPFAKTVEDAELLFEAISGKDIFDATSSPHDAEKQWNSGHITIGVPKEYFASGLEKDVEALIRKTLAGLERQGAEIREISLPHSSYALPTYYIIVPSEVSANLARFDGIRYGRRVGKGSLFDLYAKTRGEGFGTEVKRRIMLGTYTLSAGYYEAYYAKAQKVRAKIRDDFKRAFEDVDVIAGPTTPTPAFRFGENMSDPLKMYLADVYTVAMPLAGVPALSLPAGFVEREGAHLPVGLQLTAPWFEEKKLFSTAKLAEKLISL